MDWFVKAFVKSSLAWLALGVTLGVCMAAHPVWVIYRTAHLHMNLLGFVTMMIYGVAYHVLPRFAGSVLHSRRLAGLQVWLSNAGLAILVLGFLLRPHVGPASTPVIASGGVLAALGAYMFVYNIWRTLNGRAGAQTILARSGSGSAAPDVSRKVSAVRGR